MGYLRPLEPQMPAFPRRPWVWIAAALALTGGAALLVFAPLDRRTAWDQAPLSRGKVQEDPVTLSLWANDLGPLLREAEALGPQPRPGIRLLPWLQAQCAVTQRIQELQRRYRKPVESAAEMGRAPYCEDLPQVERWLRQQAAGR